MENQQRKINTEYALMQSAYWMAYCMVLTFAAVFLQARGYSGTEIGVIMAASTCMALVLQPLLQPIWPTAPKGLGIHILWALCADGGSFSPSPAWCHVKGSAAQRELRPGLRAAHRHPALYNLPHLRWRRAGAYISISAPAGPWAPCPTPSWPLSWARWWSGWAPASVPGIRLSGRHRLMMVILAMFTARSHSRAPAAAEGAQSEGKKQRHRGIHPLNKRFSVFLLGVALLFSIHSLINNFIILVVQNVGGDSSDMGAICAYMAAAGGAGDDALRQADPALTLLLPAEVFRAHVHGQESGRFLAPSGGLDVRRRFSSRGISFALYTPAAVRYAMLVVDSRRTP
jgi:PPP family 3-phenylpropionic acid transporter